jgi:hypothetical protein
MLLPQPRVFKIGSSRQAVLSPKQRPPQIRSIIGTRRDSKVKVAEAAARRKMALAKPLEYSLEQSSA